VPRKGNVSPDVSIAWRFKNSDFSWRYDTRAARLRGCGAKHGIRRRHHGEIHFGVGGPDKLAVMLENHLRRIAHERGGFVLVSLLREVIAGKRLAQGILGPFLPQLGLLKDSFELFRLVSCREFSVNCPGGVQSGAQSRGNGNQAAFTSFCFVRLYFDDFREISADSGLSAAERRHQPKRDSAITVTSPGQCRSRRGQIDSEAGIFAVAFPLHGKRE